jgi:hypothetical protein
LVDDGIGSGNFLFPPVFALYIILGFPGGPAADFAVFENSNK